MVAPTAVSSTAAKPRALSAFSRAPTVAPSQQATKEGARLTHTGAPVAMRALAAGTSLRTSLAFCGQATKHRPQRMHSSGTMLA